MDEVETYGLWTVLRDKPDVDWIKNNKEDGLLGPYGIDAFVAADEMSERDALNGE
jgi:hypothetical protein